MKKKTRTLFLIYTQIVDRSFATHYKTKTSFTKPQLCYNSLYYKLYNFYFDLLLKHWNLFIACFILFLSVFLAVIK